MQQEISTRRLPEDKAIKPEFSLGTVQSTMGVVGDLVDHKQPSKQSVASLTESIASDLTKQGASIDKDAVSSVIEKFSKFSSSPEAVQESIEKLPSFTEVFTALNYVESLYTTPDVQKKLKRASRLLVGLEVFRQASQTAWQVYVEKVIGDKNPFAMLGGIWDRWRHRNEPGFDTKAFAADALVKTSGLWGPVVIGLSADQIKMVAQKDINAALEHVGNRINKRSTETLLLQKYAMSEGLSPGEVLQIIERGKMATIDLMLTMRADIYPSLASIAASLLPAAQINPIATLAGASKLIPEYFTSKKRILNTLKHRGKQHGEARVVDAKIASLLSNLEIAKTSGKSADVAAQLQEAMKLREEIFTKQRAEKIQKSKWEKIVDIVYEKVTPLATTGWEFWKAYSKYVAPLHDEAHALQNFKMRTNGHDRPGRPDFGGLSLNEYIEENQKSISIARAQALASGYTKSQEFAGIQDSIAGEVQRLTALYANNIIYDLQDIAEMEALLGPWNALDTPDGPQEAARVPVSSLSNLDISVKNLDVMGILSNVSFDIQQGEFVSIRAQKGEGKTTLLRALLGLYDPQKGSITFGGKDLESIKKFGPESLQSTFGYAPQNAGVIDTMTLKQNLQLWNEGIAEEKIIATMRELGLEKLIPRLNETGSHFSGGEKRLLSIVRALLTNPKILFLDEPTANLDQASIDRLVSTLQTIRKNHPDTTIITVTHDAEFAKFTDRTINLAELNKKPNLADNQVFEAKARP